MKALNVPMSFFQNDEIGEMTTNPASPNNSNCLQREEKDSKRTKAILNLLHKKETTKFPGLKDKVMNSFFTNQFERKLKMSDIKPTRD